jgi:hypothetical protein
MVSRLKKIVVRARHLLALTRRETSQWHRTSIMGGKTGVF